MLEGLGGISIGKKASLTRTITAQDVVEFSRISGDHNPLHLDGDYASKTRFGARVAHGALSIALISAVIGTKMVGHDATPVYLGQNIRFLKPVFLGDTVTVECEVTKIRADKSIVTLACRCTDQKGEELLSGEATILLDPMPFTS